MPAMTFDFLSKNKWLRRALWALATLLLLWALAWLAVPYLVKSQAEKIGSAKLGRQVQVGHVDFHPWTLALAVDDLSVAGPPGSAAPQLQIKHILLDVALWQSLRRLAPVVDAVALDQPMLRATHLGDGRYDFDDVLAKLATPPDPQPSPTPSFAVYNITLTGGAADFNDQPVHATHTLRDLHLAVPFLSNLDSQRAVKVAPHLAFTLNGSSFDSAAQSTPFADSRKTDGSFQIKNLDLAPYLPYLPASLPVKLQGAVLQADLQLAFEQTPKAVLRIRGVLQADHIQVANPQGVGWLALDTVRVALDDLRPLEQTAKIASVDIVAPALDVRRDAAGHMNLLGQPVATKNIAASAGKTSASGIKDAQPGWQITLDKLALRGGSVHWADAQTRPAARVALHDMVLDASAITWPLPTLSTQPLQFSGVVQVDDGAASAKASELRFSGSATDQQAQVDASLGGLPLAMAAPYVADLLEPRLTGQLSADLQLQWTAPDALQITAKQLTLDALSLGETALATNNNGKSGSKGAKPANTALASLRQLQLTQTQVDLVQHRIGIGKLAVTDPVVKVERGADQRWMFERWLKSSSPTASPATAAAPSKPWAVSVADLQLSGGTVSYQDQTPAGRVAFDVTALQLQMKNLVPGSAKASPLSVSARMAAGNTEPGRLSYKGTLALQPLAAQGQLDLVHLPLHALEPYYGASLNVDILRADTSFKGQLAYSDSPVGLVLKVQGDGTLEEFRANRSAGSTLPTSNAADATGNVVQGRELLSWKLLNLRGLDVALKPGAATRVDVKETALSDFYARVVVDETGRINLQDLVKPTPPAVPDATNKVATTAGAASANGIKDVNSPTEPSAVVRFGGISLVNGKVLFSDRFVKPNYSANLSELTGKLGAFSSVAEQGQVQLADLELRGRAEGTASLEILGKLNPLAKPLALDIGAKVRDLELPALSPYSVRYVGHGIERGKLSVDVHYAIQPDGQLTASNSIKLNQLTFGDAVPGAPASLPVRLATALLADSNGVIDLDLPISGSLNDPQFRIGPVIFKILGNLIAKAITSPFSLLAHAFGGGAGEMGQVGFAPGSAVLSPEAQQNLDKVAKVLADRPALKMTVVGSASLAVERDAMQRERLQRRVLAEKRRAAVTGGATRADADADALKGLAVGAAEYPDLLKAVYKSANMPKPRNAIGLLKDLSVPEMEQLLLANLPVDEERTQQLAVQRGVAVRDYLAAQNLPLERLFLGAAKTVENDKDWHPQADLQLAMP